MWLFTVSCVAQNDWGSPFKITVTPTGFLGIIAVVEINENQSYGYLSLVLLYKNGWGSPLKMTVTPQLLHEQPAVVETNET